MTYDTEVEIQYALNEDDRSEQIYSPAILVDYGLKEAEQQSVNIIPACKRIEAGQTKSKKFKKVLNQNDSDHRIFGRLLPHEKKCNRLRLIFTLIIALPFLFLRVNAQQKSFEKNLHTLAALTLNSSVINPGCNLPNGTILANAAGGTPPYLYNFQGADYGTGFFTGLNAGNYLVTVKDAAGASLSIPVTLSQVANTPISTIASYADPTGCGSMDGSVTISTTGGVLPYQYSIDGINFQSSNTISNLPATVGYPPSFVYTLWIKDATGCVTGLLSPHLAENCGMNINGISYSSLIYCDSTGFIAATIVSGGSPPYAFSLDGVNYQQKDSFTNLSAGFYKLYVRDANGLVDVKGCQISADCHPLMNTIVTNASCNKSDGNITITKAAGTPPYKYSIDGVNFLSSPVFSGLQAAYFTFAVKDANGVIYSGIDIVESNCPIVTATSSDEICNGKNGTITATGGKGSLPYSFSINGTNFQTNNVFMGLGMGNYTVTIKDSNGNTNTTNVTINSSCLQIDLAAENTTCSKNNGSITVSAANGVAPFQYSIDGITFQQSNLFSNLYAGKYIVTVKDFAGITSKDSTTLTDIAGPVLNTNIGQASCTNTDGFILISTTGGTAPFEYSIDNANSFQSNNLFSNLDSGIYIPLVRDGNGCTNSQTINLSALPTPSVNLGKDTTLCDGESLVLSVPFQPGYTYQWQDSSFGNTYAVKKTGAYKVTVTNEFNCTASSSVNVQFTSVPSFALGADTAVCMGQILLLQALPVQQANYLWSDGSTLNKLPVSSAGLYWLQVSNNGCIKRDSINIGFKPIPSIKLGNDTLLCEGNYLVLDATNNNSTYVWQDGSNYPFFKITAPGIYTVKVTEAGCDTTGKITVNYISKPSVLLVKDTSLCFTQTLVLNASYADATYTWQDGSTQPIYIISKEGLYTIKVANVCGVENDTINVVYKNCDCDFFVPSAFTPNNDSHNDIFRPANRCVTDNYELKIFNRYGKVVFVSTNMSKGWDGSFNGADQPVGTYVWTIDYKDIVLGKHFQRKGTVVLIR